MDKQYYNAEDISNIMGICYAKALSFIKKSGIKYLKFNRTYLVSIADFDKFMNKAKNIEIAL